VTYRAKRCEGFSLLELVIVIVIMGIIAAVAIPRMSRGSAGAAEGALSGNLMVLRKAIDMYAGEHAGKYPDGNKVEKQLTQNTSMSGAASTSQPATHIYGPYLRTSPPLPVGSKKGKTKIGGGGAAGWKYTAVTGEIRANLGPEEKDASGKPYRDY